MHLGYRNDDPFTAHCDAGGDRGFLSPVEHQDKGMMATVGVVP